MPIDIKWIQDENNIKQVEEWQILRGRNNSNIKNNNVKNDNNNNNNNRKTIVQIVKEKDIIRRQLLRTLNGQRTVVKQYQQKLRPKNIATKKKVKKNDAATAGTANDNDNNESTVTSMKTEDGDIEENVVDVDDIKQKIYELQLSIKEIDIQWKTITKEMNHFLYKLCSCVDTTILSTYGCNKRNLDFDANNNNHANDDYYYYYYKANDNDDVRSKQVLRDPREDEQNQQEQYYHHHHLNNFQLSYGSGFHIKQAIHTWSRNFFHHYTFYEFSNSSTDTSVKEPEKNNNNNMSLSLSSSSSWSLTTDMANSLWGCIEDDDDDHDDDDDIMDKDDDRTTRHQQHNTASSSSSSLLKRNISTVPAWIGLITKHITPKSIYGARQLPLYTCLWMNNNNNNKNDNNNNNNSRFATTTSSSSSSTLVVFEIIAMTSGTLWDSRTIQTELINELIQFYQSILHPKVVINVDDGEETNKTDMNDDRNNISQDGTTTWFLQPIAVSPKQLHPHEVSRVEIVLFRPKRKRRQVQQEQHIEQQQNHHHFVLGSVSNFGDGISRGWDINFHGGGGTSFQSSKEYVHFVHASVLRDDTINAILQCNVHMNDMNNDNNDNNDIHHPMMTIRRCLVPYFNFQFHDLVRHNDNNHDVSTSNTENDINNDDDCIYVPIKDFIIDNDVDECMKSSSQQNQNQNKNNNSKNKNNNKKTTTTTTTNNNNKTKNKKESKRKSNYTIRSLFQPKRGITTRTTATTTKTMTTTTTTEERMMTTTKENTVRTTSSTNRNVPKFGLLPIGENSMDNDANNTIKERDNILIGKKSNSATSSSNRKQMTLEALTDPFDILFFDKR